MTPSDGGAPRLEVWRGRRRLLEGTPDDVIRAARDGRIRHSDRIGPGGSAERVPPRAIPELTRLVPGEEEYLLRRSLRALLAFRWVAWPAVALVALASAGVLIFARPLQRDDWEMLAVLLGSAAGFALFFLAPIGPLRRRARALEAAREAGAPSPAVVRTTGEPRLDQLLRRRPVVTWTVTAVVVATSLLAFVLPDEALAWRLAKVNDRILAGEWWRLFSVALVHGSPLHLAFNGFALVNLGGLAETLYGRLRLGAVLAAGTAVATAASVAWSPAPSVGASGGIFALVGALLVLGLRGRGVLPEPVRRKLLRDMTWIAAVNLALGATIPYVDNAAHLGGLVAGAALGALLGPAPEVRRLFRPGPPPDGPGP